MGRSAIAIPRGGADQRKWIQGQLYAAGIGSAVDHYIDPVIFHRGIQVFFHHRTQPVDLIDEEHIVGFQAGQQSGQVSRLLK